MAALSMCVGGGYNQINQITYSFKNNFKGMRFLNTVIFDMNFGVYLNQISKL